MKLKRKNFILLILAAFLILLLPFVIYVAQKSQDIRKKAIDYFYFQTDPSLLYNIYFDPIDITLTGDTPVKIMGNFPGLNIAFARVVFTFDASKVNLSSEIVTSSSLTSIVADTKMADANTNGKVVFVIAAKPADVPPTGNFELASFSIVPVSGAIDATSIDFDIADMQIVDKLGATMQLNPGNANVIFAGTTVEPTQEPPTPDPNVTVIDTPNPTQNPSVSGKPSQGGDDDNDDDGVKDKDDKDDDNDGVEDKDDDDDNNDGVKEPKGDANRDGKVNLQDLLYWVKNLF